MIKKIAYTALILLTFQANAFAYKTKFNPFTSKLDYVSANIGDVISSGTARHNLFIDASGNLADTMAASLAGVLYDGDTNPYTGEQASIVVNAFTRTIGDNDGNPVSPVLGSFILTNNYNPSIGNETSIQNTALQGKVVSGAAYNVDAVDDTEQNFAGLFQVERSGTISGGGNLIISNYGLYSSVLTNTSYTSTASQYPKDYGLFINMAASTSGTPPPNHESYGIYLSQATTGLGDLATAYGFYVNALSSGGDGDAWFIYCVPDVPSYFKGDISINSTSVSAQLNQVIDTNTRIGHRIQGAASQSSDFLSILDSNLSTTFSVSPNTAASAYTLFVKTAFDSADSVQARFAGPDRGTAANFDRFSWEFYLDDSNETQVHFAEIEFVAQTVTNTNRFGGMNFYTEFNSSNIVVISLGTSAAGGTGFLFNNSKVDMDFDVNGDNTDDVYKMDASLDANIFTVSGSRASAAGATWNGMRVTASTATITGSTNITTSTGFNLFNIARPILNSSSAVTVTNSATLYIEHSPNQLGSCTITNPYAIWVDDGISRFDGTLNAQGELDHDGTTIGFFGTTPTTQQGSIADPAGGVVIDAEARTAINSILDVLDAYGLTA